MNNTGVSVMDYDRDDREALAAAGYTGFRGAVLFCLVLAAVGALLGSVVLAIVWNMLVPGVSETLSTAVGAVFGAILLVLVGLIKIRQGNLEARELVDDRQWRRLVLRAKSERPE